MHNSNIETFRGCDSCTPNVTTLFNNDCQCVLGDGFERSTLAINRHIPGPSIQVCRDDRVVVDVTNKIQAEELTIHWHGIFQRGTPWYDGVPMVTQCPIGEGMTFRYNIKKPKQISKNLIRTKFMYKNKF